jgi:holin-like protein
MGLLLLLGLLQWPPVRAPVEAIAQVLLSHLSLLFVPVGVGVITHLGLVLQFGGQLLVVIVLSTWVGLAVTALVLRQGMRGSRGSAAPPSSTDAPQTPRDSP